MLVWEDKVGFSEYCVLALQRQVLEETMDLFPHLERNLKKQTKDLAKYMEENDEAVSDHAEYAAAKEFLA